MPVVQQQSEQKFEERPLIPAEVHILTLVATKQVEVAPSGKFVQKLNANGKVDKLIHEFESLTKDDDGNPYTHAEWTGVVDGNEKAGLTILLDQMMPGVPASERAKMTPAGFDTDVNVGKQFEAKFSHVVSSGKPPKTYATMRYIEPYSPKGNKGGKK